MRIESPSWKRHVAVVVVSSLAFASACVQSTTVLECGGDGSCADDLQSVADSGVAGLDATLLPADSSFVPADSAAVPTDSAIVAPDAAVTDANAGVSCDGAASCSPDGPLSHPDASFGFSVAPWCNDPSRKPAPRYYFANALGPDGRIYVMGGWVDNGDAGIDFTNNGVIAYDLALKCWTRTASMGLAQYDFGAQRSQNRIYAVGGEVGPSDLSYAESFAPGASGWEAIAPMPTARSSLSVAAGLDGRLYAAGGWCDFCGDCGFPQALNAFEAYDVASGQWSILTPMPTARGRLATTTSTDGRVFAMGGDNEFDTAIVEAFDPRTQLWQTKSPMHVARASVAAATGADGRIYVIGGNINGNLTAYVEAYSPSKDLWTTVAPIPEAREFSTSAIALPDGRIFVVGGHRESVWDPWDLFILVYDIATDRWTHEP
jgi:hypothetical protein